MNYFSWNQIRVTTYFTRISNLKYGFSQSNKIMPFLFVTWSSWFHPCSFHLFNRSLFFLTLFSNNSHYLNNLLMKIFQKLLVIFSIWVALLMPEALMKTPNPYKVLGIKKDATQTEIKKAFNKRSRKYHPDVNKTDPRAKEKFQKVVNAYELLKDPERRRMYDMTGTDDPQQMNMGGGFPGGGGFGMNMEDLFNMGFGGFGGGGGRQRQKKGGRRGGRTFTFSFGGGGGNGYRFQM